MLLKIITLLIALVAIATGIRTLIKREAKFGGGDADDGDGYLLLEGIPAVLLGLVEIAVGVYILIYQRAPNLL